MNPDARYLVSTHPVHAVDNPRRLLIICDRPYTNVPRGLFFSSPPTHAAAFSDGSVQLISVAEFAALDRSSLVPLEERLSEPK